VSQKLVEQGDYIKQGQPLLKIANLSTVWANFDVYENQIDQFKKGQEIAITSKAYANKVVKAKVDFINPVLDSKTRTVKLRAVLNNSDNAFKPGMFVEGKITGMTSKKQTLSIPSSAVLWTGERSLVYVKADADQPVFEMREIVLGNQMGTSYEVIEGLNNGDEIVTNGTFTVDAAAQLQGKKSMMNKEGGKTSTGHEGHGGSDISMSSKTEMSMNERIDVSKEFQNQLRKVYDSYINLKNALVKDDSQKASKDAKDMQTNMSRVDMKLLTNNTAHNQWMSLENEIKKGATAISSATNIKDQRTHFKPLSSNLIEAVQVFGVNEKVFVEFCPMADNNNGAFWLSKQEQILNPYYGDAMLKCGSVKQTIE
jgi:Cu(I)/Ag(I) efflux system membrane fusion protein